jgi:hypothetical protein
MNGMTECPGDEWKEASVTRRDVLRYTKMRDRLLVMLPWYQTPMECYIVDHVNDGDYIRVALSPMGQQWIKRSQLDVVAILPTKLTPKPAMTVQEITEELKNYTPPWIEGLGEGV